MVHTINNITFYSINKLFLHASSCCDKRFLNSIQCLTINFLINHFNTDKSFKSGQQSKY